MEKNTIRTWCSDLLDVFKNNCENVEVFENNDRIYSFFYKLNHNASGAKNILAPFTTLYVKILENHNNVIKSVDDFLFYDIKEGVIKGYDTGISIKPADIKSVFFCVKNNFDLDICLKGYENIKNNKITNKEDVFLIHIIDSMLRSVKFHITLYISNKGQVDLTLDLKDKYYLSFHQMNSFNELLYHIGTTNELDYFLTRTYRVIMSAEEIKNNINKK